MVFSDTTNKNGIIQRIEDYCNFADGVITSDPTLLAKITANVNETVHELTNELMLQNDSFDWDDPYKTDYPIATTPLTTDRDYQFDDISFLKLKRVDISYDSTNYYRAEAFDSGSFEYGLGNDDLVDDMFSKTEPKYDPKGFGFWLYPRANAEDVAAGGLARIEFSRSFDEFVTTDTTQEPPIDRPFHDLVALGASKTYMKVKDSARGAQLEQEYGVKVRQPDGSYYWTGKVGSMLDHYSKRNEDASMEFNSNVFNNFK